MKPLTPRPTARSGIWLGLDSDIPAMRSPSQPLLVMVSRLVFAACAAHEMECDLDGRVLGRQVPDTPSTHHAIHSTAAATCLGSQSRARSAAKIWSTALHLPGGSRRGRKRRQHKAAVSWRRGCAAAGRVQAVPSSLVVRVQVLHRTDALAPLAATAGTACREALLSLHCALEFSCLRCDTAPEQQVPKPCVSACESIVELCAQSIGGGFDGSMCTVDRGYGAEGDCGAVPRQV